MDKRFIINWNLSKFWEIFYCLILQKYIKNVYSLYITLPPLENKEKIILEVKNRILKAKVLEIEAKYVYEKAKREVEEMI